MDDFTLVAKNPIIKKRDDSITRILDGRAFIVEKENGHPIRLNPVGTQIWQLLETPQRASDLIAFICGQYEIDAQEATKDLEIFLTALMQKKFIELEN
jgi:hypothetical protein